MIKFIIAGLFLSRIALAAPPCDLESPNKAEIVKTYKGEAPENDSQDAGIKAAAEDAIRSCTIERAKDCAVSEAGECSHFTSVYGRATRVSGWICLTHATGKIVVFRSYEEICQEACTKISACRETYKSATDVTPADVAHLDKLSDFYSCK